MKINRYILIIILIGAMVLPKLPFFNPNDATRDNRVDLQDAIVWIRDFARTVEDPSAFTTSVQKVLSTLNVVAGLKTVIKKGGDTRLVAKSFAGEFCLMSSLDYSTPLGRSSRLDEHGLGYRSVVIAPDFPPPRLG
jgi:hypothetical protein